MFRFLIIITIVLSNTIIISQSKPLAKIGERIISKDDFRFRYEMTPRMETSRNKDSLKHEFLYSLVAEKLWAQEAEKLGYDTLDFIKNSVNQIEKMFVRDALFKQEIESKVSVSSFLIAEGKNRTSLELKVKFIFDIDSNEIYSIYKSLEDGATFDSLLQDRNEASEQIRPVSVVFGQLEKKYEDILFSLKEGEFSEPTKQNGGWIIYFLKDRQKREFQTAKAKEWAYKNVKRTVKSRITGNFYSEFYMKFHKNRVVNVDSDLFRKLIGEINNFVAENEIIKEQNFYYLDHKQINKIKSSFDKNTLNKSFVKYEKDPLTLNDYFNRLLFLGLKLKDKNPNTIKSVINNDVRNFLETELYCREGYNRGLEQLPGVKSSVQKWRDNYLAGYYRNSFVEDVKPTDDELYEYYQKISNENSSGTYVNIQEILVSNLEDVEMIFNELDKGTDFEKLANKYTNREWTKEKDGEFGFFNVNELPQIGDKANNLEIGEIFGPIKLKEGYSIIKLIDKRKDEDLLKEFDKEKEKIEQILFYKKMTEKLAEKTVKLANESDISINKTMLNSIETTEINMVVMKHIGFGGKILAVPFLSDFSDWFKKYQKSESPSL